VGRPQARPLQPYLEAAAAGERFGVVAIVAAQEFQSCSPRRGRPWRPTASGSTASKRNGGSGYTTSISLTLSPGWFHQDLHLLFPIKVWLTGHEWAKLQADAAKIGYRSLANGFAACDDPAACTRSVTVSAPHCRSPDVTAQPGLELRTPRRRDIHVSEPIVSRSRTHRPGLGDVMR
jgi:hypothetical protein